MSAPTPKKTMANEAMVASIVPKGSELEMQKATALKLAQGYNAAITHTLENLNQAEPENRTQYRRR